MEKHRDPRIIEACALLDQAHAIQNCRIVGGYPGSRGTVEERMAEAGIYRAAASALRIQVHGQ